MSHDLNQDSFIVFVGEGRQLCNLRRVEGAITDLRNSMGKGHMSRKGRVYGEKGVSRKPVGSAVQITSWTSLKGDMCRVIN